MLIAARELLAEGGAAAVTTRAVAKRAGVGVGSLYEYFPNREAILAHLVEEILQQEARVRCLSTKMSAFSCCRTY